MKKYVSRRVATQVATVLLAIAVMFAFGNLSSFAATTGSSSPDKSIQKMENGGGVQSLLKNPSRRQ